MSGCIFVGQVINTKSLEEFVLQPKGFVAVDATGKIIGLGDDADTWRQSISSSPVANSLQTIRLQEGQFLMPGFVDCHIHAPQVAQIGLGLDLPLLDWLHTYTFPLEAHYSDPEFALKVYREVVSATIRCGTTLASYFGTNHKDSTLLLAKEAQRQGQRALVGKVCSNCNSPDYYIEASTQDSLKATEEFVEDVLSLQSELVKPIITPRFALSCSRDLMQGLGRIARLHDINIQVGLGHRLLSHISESLAEIEFVKQTFNSSSYAKVYDDVGLLTTKTIMAHGVHLEDEELKLLRERGTSIAHCPASNTMLHSGLCDVRRLLSNGIRVGLGTDVSGGNSLSIMDAILRALDVSCHLQFIKTQEIKGTGRVFNGCVPKPAMNDHAKYQPLNYREAIYLATLGGAEALSLDHITGNFAVGKQFDALIIEQSPIVKTMPDAPSARTETQKLKELVERFLYVGDDRNIVQVYVSGKRIK